MQSPKRLSFIAVVFTAVALFGQNPPPSLSDLNQVWRQTFGALKNGQSDQAKQLFQRFNQELRLYLSANGLDWKSEYLAGSLDCQFPESREMGEKILKSLLQDNRDLNEKGKTEIQSLLQSCAAHATSRLSDGPRDPEDILSASAHFQTPGIHSITKGGSLQTVGLNLSGVLVTPKSASELLARRMPVSESDQALRAALTRIPLGATGGIVDNFVITYPVSDKAVAMGIGKCLQSYIHPLGSQFGIGPPHYVITAYTATDTEGVYNVALRLHGLQLPPGTIAYSVTEDMSLSGVATPSACGSMAHELVHLLIKPSFPIAPAWLEEGLASEVAVASPEVDGFTLGYSWRDEILKEHWGLRPTVSRLLELSWSDFNATSGGDLTRAAAVQAMAAAFIRYLDSVHKLPEVYFAVRDKHLSPDLLDYRSYQQIVTEKLGRASIDEVDHDFRTWFAQYAPLVDVPRTPCKSDTPMAQTACPPTITRLNGTGSTVAYALYAKWAGEYHAIHPDVDVSFQSTGSGDGIKQVLQAPINFRVSDLPLPDDQLNSSPVKVVHLPTTVTAVVPIYNLPTVQGTVNFSQRTLAGIYLGKITRWNDAALKESNPGIILPDLEIALVHRSDGSGTTYTFTDFLSKVDPEWATEVGRGAIVNWLVGLGVKGNQEVADLVKQKAGSVGYVDLTFALQNEVPFGAVQNAAGNFVKADQENTSEAAASVELPSDFRVSLTNPPGPKAYPIAAFTYLLIPARDTSLQGKSMVDFLTWAFLQGQTFNKQMGYPPLPPSVTKQVQEAINQLQ